MICAGGVLVLIRVRTRTALGPRGGIVLGRNQRYTAWEGEVSGCGAIVMAQQSAEESPTADLADVGREL